MKTKGDTYKYLMIKNEFEKKKQFFGEFQKTAFCQFNEFMVFYISFLLYNDI